MIYLSTSSLSERGAGAWSVQAAPGMHVVENLIVLSLHLSIYICIYVYIYVYVLYICKINICIYYIHMYVHMFYTYVWYIYMYIILTYSYMLIIAYIPICIPIINIRHRCNSLKWTISILGYSYQATIWWHMLWGYY